MWPKITSQVDLHSLSTEKLIELRDERQESLEELGDEWDTSIEYPLANGRSPSRAALNRAPYLSELMASLTAAIDYIDKELSKRTSKTIL